MPGDGKETLVDKLYVSRTDDGSVGLGLLRYDPGAREAWRKNNLGVRIRILEDSLAEAAKSGAEGSIDLVKCLMELDEEGLWFRAALPDNQNLVTVLRHCYEDREMRDKLLQSPGLPYRRDVLGQMVGAGHLWALELICDDAPIFIRGCEMSGTFLRSLPNVGLDRFRFEGELRISRDNEDAWNDLRLAYPERDFLFRTWNRDGDKMRSQRWSSAVFAGVRTVPDDIEKYGVPVRISFDPGLDGETYVRCLEEIKAERASESDLRLSVDAKRLSTLSEELFRRAAEVLTGRDEISGDYTALIRARRVSYLDAALGAKGQLCQRLLRHALNTSQDLNEAELYSLDRGMVDAESGTPFEFYSTQAWPLLMKMIKVARDPQVYRLAVRHSVPRNVDIKELHWALTQTKSLGAFMRLQSSGHYHDKLVSCLSLRVVINKHPDTARRILGEAEFTKDEIAELVGRKNQKDRKSVV